MGFAELIEKKFMHREICIFLGEEVETLIIDDQHWISNKAYFRGHVEDIDEGIITLIVPENGPVYIDAEKIVALWEDPFDYHKAVRTSITRRMVGAKYKDGG